MEGRCAKLDAKIKELTGEGKKKEGENEENKADENGEEKKEGEGEENE